MTARPTDIVQDDICIPPASPPIPITLPKNILYKPFKDGLFMNEREKTPISHRIKIIDESMIFDMEL